MKKKKSVVIESGPGFTIISTPPSSIDLTVSRFSLDVLDELYQTIKRIHDDEQGTVQQTCDALRIAFDSFFNQHFNKAETATEYLIARIIMCLNNIIVLDTDTTKEQKDKLEQKLDEISKELKIRRWSFLESAIKANYTNNAGSFCNNWEGSLREAIRLNRDDPRIKGFLVMEPRRKNDKCESTPEKRLFDTIKGFYKGKKEKLIASWAAQ